MTSKEIQPGLNALKPQWVIKFKEHANTPRSVKPDISLDTPQDTDSHHDKANNVQRALSENEKLLKQVHHLRNALDQMCKNAQSSQKDLQQQSKDVNNQIKVLENIVDKFNKLLQKFRKPKEE